MKIADGLTIRRDVACGSNIVAIEVARAHVFGQQTEMACDAIEDFFSDQHALGAAETTERGVRGQVGLRNQAFDMHVRAEVGVVDVHHRAHQNRRRKVGAPAAVGDEADLERRKDAVVIEADRVAGGERVPLAGHLHVDAARQLDAHRALRHMGSQCRDRRVRIGLGFLATESATHAQAAADHATGRQAEHAGNDDLGLGRMLGRRSHLDNAFGINLRPARLRFEVEMILAADCYFTFQAVA